MNVYVETNFVLELAFLQEQHASCEGILRLCEEGEARVVIPAYSLAEPYETLGRRHGERKRLKADLDRELRQLGRTEAYAERLEDLREATALLSESAGEEAKRLEETAARLARCSDVIPLRVEILLAATDCQLSYDLSPQDALVCASVLVHLDQGEPSQSCFLNRNLKDFENPDLVKALRERRCRMLPGFDDGYSFLQSFRQPPNGSA